MPTPSPAAPPATSVWSDREAAFYAEHLAASDYLSTVGTALRQTLGHCGDLLDIGAGSGLLGQALLQDSGRWTALEPNAYMRTCISALAARTPGIELRLHDSLWQDIPRLSLAPAEVVLCANIPVADGQARHLLEHVRPLARRALAWNVPAQEGPRTYCLSGFLPASLHGSDTTPGHLLVLDDLGERLRPDAIHFTHWRFSTVFPHYDDALAHFQEKLGPLDKQRLRHLHAHLREHLQEVPGGWLASAPKCAATLIWHA
ncbi:class I SAM-dependent methyltransferase [Pseudomonas sp. ABC1]|uniref:class I SAM-dependent methyltransferase n=1 Tax=Pseudomonas sp. ABC1 TaxID=2748080 RepID=UPI0015C3ABCC|nr:class I SAM-dependent methyltransferase [Pseudomonas sp. ABC1]QLF92143.1 class I SAM-dependent methyltransferase [Pseudomonas sp. ABC1]